jgi:hypothetical protein
VVEETMDLTGYHDTVVAQDLGPGVGLDTAVLMPRDEFSDLFPISLNPNVQARRPTVKVKLAVRGNPYAHTNVNRPVCRKMRTMRQKYTRKMVPR